MSARSDNRVLIVIPDPARLTALADDLLAAGFDVVAAGDGAAALRLIAADGPQLVVVDRSLPDTDAADLCRKIRALKRRGFVFIVVLTPEFREDWLIDAFEAGADNFYLQSVGSRALIARLRSGLRIVRLDADLAARTREMHLQNAKLALANDRLHHVATTDELTGLLNRRAAIARLQELWSLAARHNRPLAVILLDIDRFKHINDSHGHDAGDAVLRRVAATLRRSTRFGESVCRVGGDEFLVLCPDATADMAAAVAGRLRKSVAAQRIRHAGVDLSVTISLGVAERGPASATADDLLKAADEALYAAKRAGRDGIQRPPGPSIFLDIPAPRTDAGAAHGPADAPRAPPRVARRRPPGRSTAP